GGDFTAVNGIGRNRIARLTADGALDATFNPGVGADGSVYDIAVQSDGKVVMVGEFHSMNSTARNNVARLNADGSIDSSFTSPIAPGDSNVFSLAIAGDGRIILGGFMLGREKFYVNVARLNTDGSFDPFFNASEAVGGGTLKIALQPDGKVITSVFISIDGVFHSRVVRFSLDGSIDKSFNTGTYSFPFSILLMSNGKILIGGLAGGGPGVVRQLNSDGSLDMDYGTEAYANGVVDAIALTADDKV